MCQEILLVSPGIATDDLLKESIGFLEACRDRMIDLIDAGTQGLLSEELFAMVLKINDDLMKTLFAEKVCIHYQSFDICNLFDVPNHGSCRLGTIRGYLLQLAIK